MPRSVTRAAPILAVLLLTVALAPLASAAPSNDGFAAAAPMTANPFTDTRSTSGASLEIGEPQPCGSIGATVWYTYTATADGTLTVGTEGSVHDTVVAAYTGSTLATLLSVACNDDTAGFQSRIVLDVDAGETYHIQAGGWRGATGSLVLHAAFAPVTEVVEEDEVIQPGDSLNGNCTLSFVFDGANGDVYIATAAHCVTLGQVCSTPGFAAFGTVVFDGDDNDASTDVALIRVDPAYRDAVAAEVRGHLGTPNGYTLSTQTSTGDATFFSGYGTGVEASEPTRERRAGVLTGDDTQTYTLDGPLLPGDSGGPILHVSGAALGIVSRFNLDDLPPTTDIGPTVEGTLTYLAMNGYTVTLRTA